mmetsp:Transcript_43799/g.78697  ORF Transcript_43799/g.78697 Transcript_43799/m.78697 type:complete len:234 (-) Transcript_43799:3943-4644(-)
MGFMGPAPCKVFQSLHGLFLASTDAKVHLGEISKVECVMTFGRRWKHILGDLLVHGDGRLHTASATACNSSREASEPESQDCVEDSKHTLGFKGRHKNQVEMPLETSCHEWSTTTWWTHCTDTIDVNEITEIPGFSVIPTPNVDELTQELNGRLVTIGLLGRHVHVVDEHQAFLSEGRSVVTLPTLIQLAINYVLCLVGRCLRAKGKGNVSELFLVKVLQQFLLDHYSLTSAC